MSKVEKHTIHVSSFNEDSEDDLKIKGVMVIAVLLIFGIFILWYQKIKSKEKKRSSGIPYVDKDGNHKVFYPYITRGDTEATLKRLEKIPLDW